MQQNRTFSLLSLLVILVLVFSIAGCASAPAAEEKGAEDYKMVLILPGPLTTRAGTRPTMPVW